MAIQYAESAPVEVRFTIGDFTDCLHFTDAADRAQYSVEQIEAIMQARHDNWLAVINAAPAAPTPEDLQATLDSLVAQQAATQEQIVAIAPPEIVVPILEAQAATIAGQIAALGG